MKVIIYKHSYQSTASFRAWLYGIARNTSVDFFHRHQRAPVPEDPAELDTSTEGTLYDNFELNERHRRFAKALERLPHELREILVLHRYQALQYSEIAQLLDCNLNTLKAKMRKAVSELHKNYTEISNGAADES